MWLSTTLTTGAYFIQKLLQRWYNPYASGCLRCKQLIHMRIHDLSTAIYAFTTTTMFI